MITGRSIEIHYAALGILFDDIKFEDFLHCSLEQPCLKQF